MAIATNWVGMTGLGNRVRAAFLPMLATAWLLLPALAATSEAAGPGEIAAGNGHSCAIRAGGTVVCWGDNQYGQLGTGAAGLPNPTPVEVPGLTGVVQISAGENYTCALTVLGELQCWGWNIVGQVGVGSVSEIIPAPRTTLTEVASVSAGFRHACAVLFDSTLTCWGHNFTGQLGDGTNITRTLPQTILLGIAEVAAGGDFTCARRLFVLGNEVVCWGGNASGQLGDGSRVARLSPFSPDDPLELELVDNLTSALSITAGQNFACALLSNRAVTCWGYGGLGTMGNGTSTPTINTQIVAGPAGPFESIDAGQVNVCGVTTAGTVSCWGGPFLGNNTGNQSNVPVGAIGLSDVAAVAGGGSHNCALDHDDAVYCWGQNLFGQIGDGTLNTGNKLVPVAVVFGGAAIPAVTTTLSSTNITLGASISDLVTVTGTVGAPTGSVTVTMYSDSACTIVALAAITENLAAGAGSVSTATVGPFTPFTAGTFYLRAHYTSTSASYQDADSTCTAGTLSVGPGSSSASTALHNAAEANITSGASVALGTVVHALATIVTPANTVAPSGAVAFRSYPSAAACAADTAFNAGTTQGSALLDGSIPGVAHPSSATGFGAGTHAFRSRWSGDANYSGSLSACVTVVVLTATPTLTTLVHDAAHVEVTSVIVGSAVHPVLQLTGPGGAPAPAGSITVRWFGNPACKGSTMSAGATLGIDGSVHLTSFAQTATKVGGAAFQTTYAGDANYASVAGPCHSIAVTAQLVPTITTAIHDASHAVVTNVAVGTTVHDSVTLAGAAGDPTPTGTITLEWFTSARCKGKASVTSSALALTGGTVDATAFPQTPLAAGAYSFQAVYSGDALFASRTGPCEALTVP